MLTTFVLDILLYLAIWKLFLVGGRVVGKSDLNENPVVSLDLDLDFVLRLRVCQYLPKYARPAKYPTNTIQSCSVIKHTGDLLALPTFSKLLLRPKTFIVDLELVLRKKCCQKERLCQTKHFRCVLQRQKLMSNNLFSWAIIQGKNIYQAASQSISTKILTYLGGPVPPL